MSLGLFELGLAVVCAVIVTSCFWAMVFGGRSVPLSTDQNQKHAPIVFLLSGDEIVDTTAGASALLSRVNLADANRDELIDFLTQSFPALSEQMGQTSDLFTVEAADWTNTELQISQVDTQLTLAISSKTDTSDALIDAICLKAENAELNSLRDVVRCAPTMMWRFDENGQLAWANDAYLNLADACASQEHSTPCLASTPLFSDCDLDPTPASTPKRCSIQTNDDDAPRWFDIATTRTAAGAFHYASDANAAVRAELAQRKFMQTLSQTFAQLSIGLAIFDRKRQLATFNPALLDMTDLNFEFLSGRPTLDSILDRLRDSRMLPEPKNYASWREQFSAMEQAAKNGTYSENWNLPDGQTFRVTGRPHPDGAFALLFEDISAEVSLTRRFRSEIETSQAVLDHLNDAVAVFSNSGNLVLANTAYCELWGTDLTNGLMQYDLRVELRKWQDRCTPTRIWTNLREFSSQIGLRKTWSDTAIMDDGRQITCKADPIAGGMTLMRFTFEAPMKPTIRKLTQRDDALLTAKA